MTRVTALLSKPLDVFELEEMTEHCHQAVAHSQRLQSSEAQNNKQTQIRVLWTWYYSFASSAANHLFLALLARLFIDGIIFGDKRACTPPDMILQLAPAENQFAARLLHQRVRENKQILISIINQVHMEVLHSFPVQTKISCWLLLLQNFNSSLYLTVN